MESIHVNYIIKKPTIDSIKQLINDKNLHADPGSIPDSTT